LISSSNYHIILGSRDLTNGTEAALALLKCPIKGTVESVQIDVTDDDSVDAAARKVKDSFGRLDILINNAGIGARQNPSIRDAMREVLAVNVVGVVSVTEAFLPLLRKSSAPRLIFVSSTTGSITIAADPTGPLHGGGAMDYRSSKAALNMLMVLYWNRLEQEGFKVFGANPGLIATNFHGGGRPGSEPAVGGERIAAVVRGDRDADLGKVCTANGVLPW
jgi:NAD(P)-dependent dehydrogenase (short-subunit alcohol dehydrogenase family)